MRILRNNHCFFFFFVTVHIIWQDMVSCGFSSVFVGHQYQLDIILNTKSTSLLWAFCLS